MRLELRSCCRIVIAYLVAPLVGAFVLFCILMLLGGTSWQTLFQFYTRDAAAIAFGICYLLCFFIEVIWASLFLALFVTYRWSWLNGWMGAALGFVLGSFGWWVFGGQLLGGLNPIEVGVAALRSETPEETTRRVTSMMLTYGMAGLISATAFRFLAVRSCPAVEAA
jgi:predicted neutral ceramidase superfamily lipid hydrolase